MAGLRPATRCAVTVLWRLHNIIAKKEEKHKKINLGSAGDAAHSQYADGLRKLRRTAKFQRPNAILD